MSLTMHDLFAGAGGSSTGAIAVPGVAIRLAMNHWPLAVTVHNENHPDADHLCADIDTDALGTLTTRDRYALIMRNNSSRQGDGAEMSTPASEPYRTLTTKGHQSIIEPGDVAAAEAQVDDCLFRMLEPHEVAAGMAFPGDYRWQGTRRERVRMAGNAVTPPAARDLVGAVVEALS